MRTTKSLSSILACHLGKFLTSLYVILAQNWCVGKSCQSDGLLHMVMRLRRGLLVEDLSHRFNIAMTTATDSFHRMITVMFQHLSFLIKCPSKETCQANLPLIFKDTYPRACCIIDCSERFIERPYSYQAL